MTALYPPLVLLHDHRYVFPNLAFQWKIHGYTEATKDYWTFLLLKEWAWLSVVGFRSRMSKARERESRNDPTNKKQGIRVSLREPSSDTYRLENFMVTKDFE